MKIIVLGAGLVGGPIALDLASNHDAVVTSADLNAGRLTWLKNKATGNGLIISTIQTDLSNAGQVTRLVSDFDMVVNAVPGSMGFNTLKAIIEAGKNVVDIAFFIEDPMELHQLAREKNVTALVDMGVAPGMCNVLIGHACRLLDELTNVWYMVGGLPAVREWPWEYKAGFSPADVIEEYTRPARLKEFGNMVVKPALSDPELISFPGIGTLEAFNTDGLRSLIHTIPCANMKEKTLRYPGHMQKMKILRETGFFSTDPVEINGTSVRPLDLTSRLLFPMWQLKEGETDITIMRVVAEGRKNGEKKRYAWELHDRYDPVSGIHSMARTTGYAATAALHMIHKGLYTQKGISFPEWIGQKPECVRFLLDYQQKRNIFYKEVTF